jgi:hypothetical protein
MVFLDDIAESFFRDKNGLYLSRMQDWVGSPSKDVLVADVAFNYNNVEVSFNVFYDFIEPIISVYRDCRTHQNPCSDQKEQW